MALFVHLMSMAVGFGAVVMIDVYGLLWLFGHRTLSELTDLAAAAHGVIAVGVGGLLASGIALRPDLTLAPGPAQALPRPDPDAQRGGRPADARNGSGGPCPPETRGASIPWTVFQRGLAAALISQATWWGAITIGFITATAGSTDGQ